MMTDDLKKRLDGLWGDFWTGGITNPLTVIEQISYLMVSRLLDLQERHEEMRSSSTEKFVGKRFDEADQNCRWESWRNLGADAMLAHVRERVFPHFRRIAERSLEQGSQFAIFMTDAQLMIQKPSLLMSAVHAVQDLPFEVDEIRGDIYEYLLGKLTTAGINDQYRTPRHIIRLIVALMQPQPTERLCDPACGTAGFLVEAYESLLRRPGEPGDGAHLMDLIHGGGQLGSHRQHVDTDMFHGYDFDPAMLRIASMNLLMHGVAEPDVHSQDTLGPGFEAHHPTRSRNAFDLILTHPPFAGSVDEQNVAPDILAIVKSKKTELLFIGLILRMLKPGGRSAAIVPRSLLSGPGKAHVQLRQHLIEENRLEAVISLPSGVFKPYDPLASAIIIFAKGGNTDAAVEHRVLFYDVESDGYSLDDRRTMIGDGKGNLPDIVATFLQWRAGTLALNERTAKTFEVSLDEIRAKNFDLSISAYQRQAPVAHASPKDILLKLRELEASITRELGEIDELLG